MSDFGDIIGSIFGGDAAGGDAAGGVGDMIAGLFGSAREEQRGEGEPIIYERYLCGGPKTLGINDR
ncbi:MAG: hypothetical protein GIX03_06160 [Candidatus Eremiobacteraeota bacterium]|nr:hypothetical protein [Candidatus Eremiobacteraeota bacterium]MBC5802579.1 hypothetical protein [Candidatus Eremiobacteraeota bacterium]MBC5822175.1 hypothetical protein [Candidatus Eremiobacteraeota bacterium]